MTNEIDVDQTEEVADPHPQTVITMTAPIGSTQFEIRTENCDPMQLFAAAKVIELIGLEAFADMRAANIAQQHRIITPGQQRPILNGHGRN